MAWRAGAVLVVSSVLGVAGLGCGGGSDKKTNPPYGAETFVAGSRLKARWIQLEGGRRMFTGWFDQVIGENCTFEETGRVGLARPAASPLYCRPRSTSATGEVFADAACTQVVADVPCDDVHFAELPAADIDDCASPRRLFRIGDPVPAGTTYARLEGFCTRLASSDPQAPRSPRRLGAEVTLAELVSATRSVAPGSGRIVSTELVATDGSRQTVGAWDNERNEDVFAPNWFRDIYDGGLGKWEPVQIAERTVHSTLFADAACTAPAVSYGTCGDTPIRSVFERQDGCWPAAVYYEAGAKRDVGATFYDDGASCQANTGGDPFSSARAVDVGSRIPSTSFVTVQAWEEQSRTANRIRRPGTASGPVGPDEYIVDGHYGFGCGPFVAADGVLRCLPGQRTANSYADANCSVPVLVLSPAAAGCDTYIPPLVGLSETVSSSACDYQEKVHAYVPGGYHTGPVYGPGGGACEIIPADMLAGTFVYALGVELPPDTFPELTTSTPP